MTALHDSANTSSEQSAVGMRHAQADKLQLPESQPKLTSLTGQSETSLAVWETGQGLEAGVWECEPGEFRSERPHHSEICQILSGHGAVQGDDGTRAELEPGSLLVLPIGWSGTWMITETMRKTYIIIPDARV